MKVLENRTVDSKREMDILDALQDIRARNARNERAGQAQDSMDRLSEESDEEDLAQRQAEEEDEALVKEVFSRVRLPAQRMPQDNETPLESVVVKRKAENLESKAAEPATVLPNLPPPAKKQRSVLANSLGIKLGKPKKAAVI